MKTEIIKRPKQKEKPLFSNWKFFSRGRVCVDINKFVCMINFKKDKLIYLIDGSETSLDVDVRLLNNDEIVQLSND